MQANEAIAAALLPLGEKLVYHLAPEVRWQYVRRDPVHCELKGVGAAEQFVHRFVWKREGPQGEAAATLPTAEALYDRARAWLQAEGFEIVFGGDGVLDGAFLLTGMAERGRVTVACGPREAVASVATHPLPASPQAAESAPRQPGL